MEALIPIQKSKGGRDVVSARVLHEFLEVGTRFDMWFARRIEEYSFVQGVDYQGPILGVSGAADYAITLEMAKELSMVERNDKGREARRYFIDCENKLRAIAQAARPVLPVSYKEALTQLLIEVEAKEQLEQQLAIAAPKLAFVQAIESSTNSLSFAEAAKWLKISGMGRNGLINRLRLDKVLMKNREPYQQYVTAGYFDVQPQVYNAGEKGTRLAGTTRVTGRGLEWLQRRLANV